MDTISHGGQDGAVNIVELSRVPIEAALNEIMDVQTDDMCEDMETVRNGYRDRSLTTSAGAISLRIPKLRAGTYFPEQIVDHYSRTDKAVVAAGARCASTASPPGRWRGSPQLLGGFASRISPKRHNMPAFSQVGRADGEQLPPKTAQKSRTHGEIGAHFLRNRPEAAGCACGQGRGSRCACSQNKCLHRMRHKPSREIAHGKRPQKTRTRSYKSNPRPPRQPAKKSPTTT